MLFKKTKETNPAPPLVLGKRFFAEYDPDDPTQQRWTIYCSSEAVKTEGSGGSDVFSCSTREHAEQLVRYFDSLTEPRGESKDA